MICRYLPLRLHRSVSDMESDMENLQKWIRQQLKSMALLWILWIAFAHYTSLVVIASLGDHDPIVMTLVKLLLPVVAFISLLAITLEIRDYRKASNAAGPQGAV
jgi:hypothetical protein